MTQANDGNAPIPIPNAAGPGCRARLAHRRAVLARRRQRHHRVAAFLRHGAGGGRDQCAGRRAGPAAGAGGLRPAQRARNTAGWPAGCCWMTGQRDFRRLHLALPQGHAAGGRAQQLAAVVRLGLRRFQYSPNVIYTGAAPNQGSMQLAAYLIRHCGSRIFLVGADYIYPRETNRIMRDTVEQHGGEILDETYLRLGCDRGRHQRGGRGHPPHPAGRGVLDADRLGRRALLPPLPRDGPVGRAHAHRQPDH